MAAAATSFFGKLPVEVVDHPDGVAVTSECDGRIVKALVGVEVPMYVVKNKQISPRTMSAIESHQESISKDNKEDPTRKHSELLWKGLPGWMDERNNE